MPAPSDAAANEWLQLITRAGGSWEIVLLSTEPDGFSGGGTVITDLPAQPVARDSATWATPSARRVQMVPDVDFGTASVDAVAVAWLLRDATTHGPVHAALLAGRGIRIVTGAEVSLPGSQVFIQA